MCTVGKYGTYLMKMMCRLTISATCKYLADIVNRIFYSYELTVITKHGKDLAAIVSIEKIFAESDILQKKKL
jgi:hypothetical protein